MKTLPSNVDEEKFFMLIQPHAIGRIDRLGHPKGLQKAWYCPDFPRLYSVYKVQNHLGAVHFPQHPDLSSPNNKTPGCRSSIRSRLCCRRTRCRWRQFLLLSTWLMEHELIDFDSRDTFTYCWHFCILRDHNESRRESGVPDFASQLSCQLIYSWCSRRRNQ